MSLYCEHNRIADQCEDCAFIAAQERGAPVPPELHPREVAEPAPDTAPEDTLVDVGGNVSVLVMAGDVVPPEVADKPRRPRNGKVSRRK